MLEGEWPAARGGVHPTLEERELVAGKTQSKQTTVMDTPLSDKVAWYLHELDGAKKKIEETMRAAGQETIDPMDVLAKVRKFTLLKLTYLKTGCKPGADGPPVCSPLPFSSLSRVRQVSRISPSELTTVVPNLAQLSKMRSGHNTSMYPPRRRTGRRTCAAWRTGARTRATRW